MGTLCGHLALTLRAKWLPTDEFSVSARVLRGYAFRRQRPTIHTYAIIIAATLSTIRYSIVLSHCLTGDEPESPL